LRLGVAGDQHIQAATKAINQFHAVLPALRATHHVPFNTRSRCEEMLGQRLVAAANIPVGAIDKLAVYSVSHETRTAIELSGWAAQEGNPAECIAIVDGTGVVIGAGISATLHPGPLTQGSRRSGWKAVASYPQSMPVCAFALFPNGDVWFPLSNCQAVIPETD
jgi:hypothetical protein